MQQGITAQYHSNQTIRQYLRRIAGDKQSEETDAVAAFGDCGDGLSHTGNEKRDGVLNLAAIGFLGLAAVPKPGNQRHSCFTDLFREHFSVGPMVIRRKAALRRFVGVIQALGRAQNSTESSAQVLSSEPGNT